MIEPATLQQLVASSPIEALRNAIVTELRRLLKGVSVTAHPGKLDMNDVLAKAIVAAPGVALGWSRMRGIREIDGGVFELPVDWVAYIVTEEFADTKATPPRSVGREIVAMAIGNRMLKILQDEEVQFWGLAGVTRPSAETPPELRPLLTMKTAENAAAVYTLTWTQGLVLQGSSPFDGAPIGAAAMPDGMEFDLPEGADLPAEILALLGRDKADAPDDDQEAA